MNPSLLGYSLKQSGYQATLAEDSIPFCFVEMAQTLSLALLSRVLNHKFVGSYLHEGKKILPNVHQNPYSWLCC